MSRLDVNTIRHTGGSADNITLDGSQNVTIENNLTVDGTTTLTGAVTLPAGTTSDTLSFRNLIINGACLVSQRATSATNHGYTTVDRVTPYETGTDCGTKTFSQSDITSGDAYDAGFRKAFKVATAQAGNTNTASDYFHGYSTKLEAQDIAASGWDYTDPTSKVTLSFWIKASTADNFQLQVYADDGGKKKYNTTVAATTSWTKITKTIPGHADLQFDTNNGYGLGITLILATGSDYAGTVTQDAWGANNVAAVASSQINTWIAAGAGTVEVTGWQLEVGSSATDFEHRSYADELLRCHRYCRVYGGHAAYQRIGIGFFSNNDRIECPLTINMRTTPSMTVSATGDWKAESPSGSGEFTAVGIDGNSSPQCALVWGDKSNTFTQGESGRYMADNTTAARLYLSAEL